MQTDWTFDAFSSSHTLSRSYEYSSYLDKLVQVRALPQLRVSQDTV